MLLDTTNIAWSQQMQTQTNC